MNRFFRAIVTIPFGILKISFTKLFHPLHFHCPSPCMLSLFSEISLDYGGELSLGQYLKMRDGSKIRVRKNGKCDIGHHVAVGSQCMIVCHEHIIIGNGVQLSPNVQIYDHDHDFRVAGGISDKKFQTAPIEIGENVWIGANTVILRGSKIGAGSVVGAGCILKGSYPPNSVIIQKRTTKISNYSLEEAAYER